MATCDSPTSSPSSPSRPFSTHTHHNQQKQPHPKSQTIISSWVGGSVGRSVLFPPTSPTFLLPRSPPLSLPLLQTATTWTTLRPLMVVSGCVEVSQSVLLPPTPLSQQRPTSKTNLPNQRPQPTPVPTSTLIPLHPPSNTLLNFPPFSSSIANEKRTPTLQHSCEVWLWDVSKIQTLAVYPGTAWALAGF